MSQKLIIAIMGAVIVVGGGVWYYQTQVAGTDNATSEKSSAKDKNEKDSNGMMDSIKSGAGNFADVLRGGDAQECTFSGTDPETGEYSEGTINIAGESFRLSAETTVEGETVTIEMIQHEKVMYLWSDNDEVMPGVKIDMSMFEDMDETEKPESPIDWLKDPEAGVDYDCDSWSPRSDSFVPPEEIEFADMFGGMGAMFGEMMKQGMMEEGHVEGMDDWNEQR